MILKLFLLFFCIKTEQCSVYVYNVTFKGNVGDHPPSCKCDPSCIALSDSQRMAIIIHDEVEHDSDGKEGLTITSLREDGRCMQLH